MAEPLERAHLRAFGRGATRALACQPRGSSRKSTTERRKTEECEVGVRWGSGARAADTATEEEDQNGGDRKRLQRLRQMGGKVRR